MHEERSFPLHRAWPRAQEVRVFLRQLLASPLDGRSGDGIEPGEVHGEVRNREVVVAGDQGHLPLAHQPAALVRARPVADHVAEAVDPLGTVWNVPKDGLQGLEVAVDVGDYRVNNRCEEYSNQPPAFSP